MSEMSFPAARVSRISPLRRSFAWMRLRWFRDEGGNFWFEFKFEFEIWREVTVGFAAMETKESLRVLIWVSFWGFKALVYKVEGCVQRGRWDPLNATSDSWFYSGLSSERERKRGWERMNGGRTFNLLQQWRIPPGQSLSGRRERLGYQILKGWFASLSPSLLILRFLKWWTIGDACLVFDWIALRFSSFLWCLMLWIVFVNDLLNDSFGCCFYFWVFSVVWLGFMFARLFVFFGFILLFWDFGMCQLILWVLFIWN